MKARYFGWVRLGAMAGGLLLAAAALLSPAQAPAQKPNILVIMGDDIGWSNIGVYNQGIMSGRTPNLDRLANEGMRLPIITPKQAARQGEQTSSPASCRYGPD